MSSWLLRHTPPRPLVVTAPGGTEARLAVERAMRERGWRPAMSPAEANVLVVAGVPGHALEPYVQQVWDSIPAPRARANVTGPHDTAQQLDMASLALRDVDRQREQAARPADGHDDHHTPAEHSQQDMAPAEHDENPEHRESHDDHGDGQASHNGDSHAGHMSHGDHGGHDHHMGGMDMPGGIPMADRADDRDGLKLDQLHVPLGPALPLWPTGLIVHTRLQGDVIQHATVERLDSGHGSFWLGSSGETGTRQVVARRLDSCARLLALAGWTDASVLAQRLRDETLGEDPVTDLVPRLRKWAGRVRRSRTLRWLLAGVGSTPDDPATPPPLAGDALARLHRWLDVATHAPGQLALPDRHEAQWTVDALPALLEGTELAVARLVVASLDPDLDLLAHHEAHHG